MKTKKETLTEIKNLLLKRQSVPWGLVDDFADIINGHFNKPEKMKTNKQLQVWCIDYAYKEYMKSENIIHADFTPIVNHAKKVYNAINEVWDKEEKPKDNSFGERLAFVTKQYNKDIEKLWDILESFGVDRKWMEEQSRLSKADPLFLSMYRLSVRNLEMPLTKGKIKAHPLTKKECNLNL